MRNESDSLALEPKFAPIHELRHMKAGLYNRFKFFSILHCPVCLYVSLPHKFLHYFLQLRAKFSQITCKWKSGSFEEVPRIM